MAVPFIFANGQVIDATKVNANFAAVDEAAKFNPGVLVANTWKAFTGLPRLKLTGSGTVSIDANTATDGSGTTTSAVYTATVTTTTIAFPFFGNDAVAVRATYTGTAAAEII